MFLTTSPPLTFCPRDLSSISTETSAAARQMWTSPWSSNGGMSQITKNNSMTDWQQRGSGIMTPSERSERWGVDFAFLLWLNIKCINVQNGYEEKWTRDYGVTVDIFSSVVENGQHTDAVWIEKKAYFCSFPLEG